MLETVFLFINVNNDHFKTVICEYIFEGEKTLPCRLYVLKL